MNQVIFSEQAYPVTMTSLEIVDFINQHRKASGNNTVLRHSDFMAKVLQVLGSEYSENFRSTYFAENGKQNPCYKFPKREACLMAMSYSYELQAQIFDRMTAMEDALRKPTVPQTYAEALQLAADQARQLELAAPKIKHYDAVVEKSALLNATQVAQKVGWSAVKLNKTLDELNVYNKAILRGRAFKQWFVDQHLGIMRQTDAGYAQPMFTIKGESWIVERLISEGLVYSPSLGSQTA